MESLLIALLVVGGICLSYLMTRGGSDRDGPDDRGGSDGG